MTILCSSITWALPGFVTGVKSSFLLCLSLIGLIIPVIRDVQVKKRGNI